MDACGQTWSSAHDGASGEEKGRPAGRLRPPSGGSHRRHCLHEGFAELAGHGRRWNNISRILSAPPAGPHGLAGGLEVQEGSVQRPCHLAQCTWLSNQERPRRLRIRGTQGIFRRTRRSGGTKWQVEHGGHAGVGRRRNLQPSGRERSLRGVWTARSTGEDCRTGRGKKSHCALWM